MSSPQSQVNCTVSASGRICLRNVGYDLVHWLVLAFGCIPLLWAAVAAPVYAQGEPVPLGADVQLEVHVLGSRGGPVTNAKVVQMYTTTQGTEVSRPITYTHRGGGRYTATVSARKHRSGRYRYTYQVQAPGYARYTGIHKYSIDESESVRLVHNNYYTRCNRAWSDDRRWWTSSPWVNCYIAPDQLIETFGAVEKEFQVRPAPPESRFPEQIPDLWRTFHVRRPLPALGYPTDRIPLARQNAYENLIEAMVLAPARSQALLDYPVLYQSLKTEIQKNNGSGLRRLASGQGTAAEIIGESTATGSEITSAADLVGDVATLLELGVDLSEAVRRGYLDAILRILIYRSELNRSSTWALKHLEALARRSSLQNDPVFFAALDAVKAKVQERRTMSLNDLAERFQRQRALEVWESVLLGAGAKKAALAAAKGLAILGGKSAGAVALGTGPAAAAIAVAVLAVDAVESAADRDAQRLRMLMAPLLDALLRQYPDGSPRVNIANLSCEDDPKWREPLATFDISSAGPALLSEGPSIPVNIQSLSRQDRWGILMRLQLGLLFNEVRRSYVTGEKASWIASAWGRVADTWNREQAAYESCMAAVSNKKVEHAGTLFKQVASSLRADRSPTRSPIDASMNLALILDSSGSMSDSDPSDLRIDAARMVVDRLGSSATASVIDFDSDAHILVSGANAVGQRDQLKRAVERIDSDGGTDIGSALAKTADSFGRSRSDRKVGILLTDGRGDYNGEIKPFEKNGWCLYTVALGNKPNLKLLRSLTEKTCGQYIKATTAEDVSRGFGRVISDVDRAPLIASFQGEIKPGETIRHKIQVDGMTKDLRALLTWPGSSMDVTVLDPQERMVSQDVAKGKTYAVTQARSVTPGTYTVQVTAQQMNSSTEPYWIQVSGVSPLRPVVKRFPTAVRPRAESKIQIRIPSASVQTQSIRAEGTIVNRSMDIRTGSDSPSRSFSLTRQRQDDSLEFQGFLPALSDPGDHQVMVRIRGRTSSGEPFQRLVDRIYTVSPDAKMTTPTIERAMGTNLVIRGARTFGLQPGLTVYVHDPQGRRVARGILVNMRGNTASVSLQGVHSAQPITSQHTIRLDPEQWRADVP